MGGLVERSTGELVAAAADPALDVGLARLVARRGESQMCAYVPRSPEALRPVDRGAEGECGDRADAGNAHQPPADLLPTHDVDDLLGEAGELVQHRGEDRKQRLHERLQGDVTAGELAHAPAE